MARFACSRCGKCCRSFGAFITIERQLGRQDYYCRYRITGEIFPAHVQPGSADAVAAEYEDRIRTGQAPAGRPCIFLQATPDGTGFSCAIYDSRPRVCRNFRCYRMVISHRESGEVRGLVVGKHDLKTEDAALAALWNTEIGPTRSRAGPSSEGRTGNGQAEDQDWMRSVLPVLAAHGYRIDPVEE